MHVPVNTEAGRLRQEECASKASLNYRRRGEEKRKKRKKKRRRDNKEATF